MEQSSIELLMIYRVCDLIFSAVFEGFSKLAWTQLNPIWKRRMTFIGALDRCFRFHLFLSISKRLGVENCCYCCTVTRCRSSACNIPRTTNITKDEITSQHSDILAMCCKVGLISSFVIFAVLHLRVCGCHP